MTAAAVRDLLRQYLDETRDRPVFIMRPGDSLAGQALLGAEPADQATAVVAALATLAASGSRFPMPAARVQAGLERLAQAVQQVQPAAAGDADADPWVVASPAPAWDLHWQLGPLLGALARRQLPYSRQEICLALDALARIGRWDGLPVRLVLRSIERRIAEIGMAPEVRAALERVRAAGAGSHVYAEDRKALAQIDALLAPPPAEAVTIDADDDWGEAACAALAALPPAERGPWVHLLAHAATATAAKPAAKWSAAARVAIEEMGEAAFKARAMEWLALLQRPPSNALRRGSGVGLMAGLDQVPRAVPTERNATLLRGLIWCCSLLDDAALARAVGEAGAAAFKKIPDIGARSTKVGNACLYALGAMPGPHGAAELVCLQRTLKQPSARQRLDATMDQAAARAGLSRADLEDRAVPTHGLVDGRLTVPVGPFTAEIVVHGARRVEVAWRDAAGAPLAEEPPAARTAHAAELQRLRTTVDAIRATLLAQRDRLERLLASEQGWSYGAWHPLYLGHPLLGVLARALIWRFEAAGTALLGGWLDGQLVDVDDRPLDALPDDAAVRLWHPIDAPADTVLAWRCWLERHGVVQPFKQAHREVYLLTEAERATETYSNRFAGHILRQHQFAALCRERGWRYGLQGSFDNAERGVPTLVLSQWGLQAEYWVEPIEEDDMMTPNAIFLYLSTDQVRFLRTPPPAKRRHTPAGHKRAAYEALISGDPTRMRLLVEQFRRTRLAGAPQPVALADVPPVVFSEVMRDVDLFVGVTSVAADPAWLDTAPERYGAYWRRASFGDLSATAETRRDLLAALLPRLAIGPRCTLTDRFLVVRGDRRTYKIHLGSANILMDPNDQYLCIVPARGLGLPGEPGHFYLPFDGDTTLSLILSKAFLLADDTKIKDPTIVRQIIGII